MEPDNKAIRDCCLLPTIPRFRWKFSVSEDVVQGSAIIRPTTAEMARFIAGQDEGWLENWVAAYRRSGTTN